MKRFAFSRSGRRSTSNSDPCKDRYDPDQRPITISSYQKSRNRTPIVKPRILTNNLFDNRSSVPSNFLINTYNANNNDFNEEVEYYDTNFNQINQHPIDISTLSNSKDYVAVELPSYFNSEDLSCNFEEDNRNCSIYSPPEIKSPSTSRFNAISRFIHTSHQIDRLGHSYSSQTNRLKSSNESRIIIVDTYKEIAKKTFRQDSNNNINNDEQEKKEFLAQYLLDHTKHENAKIIQKAFRLSRNRSHFKRFIRINMRINNDLKKLTFNLWRLTVVSKTEELIKIFKQIKQLYSFIDRHFKIRDISPFRLFYVTQQLFIPKGYTANSIYKFFYLMHFRAMSRVFKVWAWFSKKRIQHRTTLIGMRFAGKKFSSFGMIYHIFVNWHRLTRWRAEARINTKKKYITLSKLNQHEANVFWNVREHNLNLKRSRIKRATAFSIKRVAAKAVRALYNRSIEATSEKAIIETSDMFRNKHLQTLAHRAWLKFMQKRLQEHQVLRDVMCAWYGQVYLIALKKIEVKLAEKLYIDNFITSIMNGWFRIAREKRIRRVAMSLRIHKKPSSMFFVIYALQNDFELAFHILCFRMWIRFTRTRKKWHFFVKWCMQANLDGSPSKIGGSKPISEIAKKERKIIVLSDLRRAAHLKIIKRGCTAATNYLPRHTWKSLELTYDALNEIRFIQDHRTLELNAKNKKMFNNESEKKTWDFLTEKVPNKKDAGNESKNLDFSASTLVRCFLLKLQNQKNYELTKVKDSFLNERVNPEFVQLRTLDELEEQSKLNMSLLRRHMIEKVRRDHATLASLMSHISAKKTQHQIRSFSIRDFDDDDNENSSFKTSYTKGDNYDSQRNDSSLNIGQIFVYPEVDESIEFLIKENSQASKRITSMFEMTKNSMLIDFQSRLRSPNYFGLVSSSDQDMIQNLPDEKPSKLGESKLSESKVSLSKVSLSKVSLSKVSVSKASESKKSILTISSMLSDTDSENGSEINLFNAFQNMSNVGSSYSLMSSSSVVSPMKFAKSPIKNALISSYVKPSSKNKDEEENLMSLVENTSARNLVGSSFTIENLMKILNRFQTQDSITQSIAIFFNNICQVQLDISDVKSLSNPKDLLPKADLNLNRKKVGSKKSKKIQKKNENEKNANITSSNGPTQNDDNNNDDDDDEIILQTHRHFMQKNMNLFIAELIGFENLDRIPLKLNITPIAESCVSAIFTIFNALKKVPSLSQYLDLTPFSKKLKSCDEILVSTQEKVWNSVKAIFPKLELPSDNSSLMNFGSISRRRSLMASSFFSIGNVQNVDDILGSNDAFLACYLLPYILSFDLVADFIKDEMKQPQNHH